MAVMWPHVGSEASGAGRQVIWRTGRRYRPRPRRRSRGTRRRALMSPLILCPLVNCQVNAVAEGVAGLVRQRLLQVPEHDADEEVLLARPGPEAPGRCCGQLVAGGGGKHADFLDARRAIAEGIADP